MNCPICNVALTVADRQGIEIDYCPRCRGVWLDRGELDKIIERSASYDRDDDDDRYRDPHRPERHHDSDYGRGHYPKKKEGFFSRMFDFD